MRKGFLTAGPGAGAGIRMQHGFERLLGKTKCIDMTDHHVSRRSDTEIMEKYMRHACDLNEPEPAQPVDPDRADGDPRTRTGGQRRASTVAQSGGGDGKGALDVCSRFTGTAREHGKQ